MVHFFKERYFSKLTYVFQFIHLFIIRAKESYCEKYLIVMIKYIKVHLKRQKSQWPYAMRQALCELITGIINFLSIYIVSHYI